MKNILILGGAGFVGSEITKSFVKNNDHVTVIDSLSPCCAGSMENLKEVISNIQFLRKDILNFPELEMYIAKADLIIDCIGLTVHHFGMQNPDIDLKHNFLPQVKLIGILKNIPHKKIIYLGSRTQYGRIDSKEKIKEDYPCNPIDVQGIHKVAAESYYSTFSPIYHFDCISLRLVNCFGENQKAKGEDIGLIGGMITNALNNQKLRVFNESSVRQFIYAKDLAQIVLRISQLETKGFEAFNIGGEVKNIYDLAKIITSLIGKGEIYIPSENDPSRLVDPGSMELDDSKLREKIGSINYTNFNQALKNTITYFQAQQL
jgi:UDP-glucose 4-epimerase